MYLIPRPRFARHREKIHLKNKNISDLTIKRNYKNNLLWPKFSHFFTSLDGPPVKTGGQSSFVTNCKNLVKALFLLDLPNFKKTVAIKSCDSFFKIHRATNGLPPSLSVFFLKNTIYVFIFVFPYLFRMDETAVKVYNLKIGHYHTNSPENGLNKNRGVCCWCGRHRMQIFLKKQNGWHQGQWECLDKISCVQKIRRNSLR